ncbi:hypothetical protein MSG28_005057 [Choristoneura fumiferana]|uniref:Uncharacterized protein n=1 Tax=Choristoneura fumiferana TaxID=7141 RepID=A0ACC0JPM9_CHOFU|nr:hypothetical protein MSG28_005057 [Choristoneura fumiferana]
MLEKDSLLKFGEELSQITHSAQPGDWDGYMGLPEQKAPAYPLKTPRKFRLAAWRKGHRNTCVFLLRPRQKQFENFTEISLRISKIQLSITVVLTFKFRPDNYAIWRILREQQCLNCCVRREVLPAFGVTRVKQKIQHNNDMAHNSVITLANDHSEENKLLFF